jgi:hypothetical protein
MNKIKLLMIIVIFSGLVASPAMATCILPDADFFYGETVDAQGAKIVSDRPVEADLNQEKTYSTFPEDILAPEIFYGYSDLLIGNDD